MRIDSNMPFNWQTNINQDPCDLEVEISIENDVQDAKGPETTNPYSGCAPCSQTCPTKIACSQGVCSHMTC